MAIEQELLSFLKEIKDLVAKRHRQFLQRNLQELADLGLASRDEAWSHILQIKPAHYEEGPSPDRDCTDGSVVWLFKKYVNGILTYIKLKVDERGCVCISFHRDR